MKAYTITVASKLNNFFFNDALEGLGGWSLLPQLAKEHLDSQNWRISAEQLFKMQFFSLPSVLVAKKIGCSTLPRYVLAHLQFLIRQHLQGRDRIQKLKIFFLLAFIYCLFCLFFFPTNRMERNILKKKKKSTLKH